MSKPREFHLMPKGTWTNVREWLSKPEDAVHVIEKSAYDKAIEVLKQYAELQPVDRIVYGLPEKAKQTLKELGELDDQENK